MDHRRVRDGWASWLLVLAAALPTAAAVRLGWVVLDGSVDDAFGSQDPPATGATLLGIRWSNLWMTSLPMVLLTGLLPLLVLAAVVVAGRPRALAPTATGRGIATVVAAVTAALGVAGVVGFVAQLVGLLPVVMWSGPTASKVDAFAPAAGAVLVTAVLGVTATVVLWPRVGDVPDEEPAPGDVVTVPQVTAEETSALLVPQVDVPGPVRPAPSSEHRVPTVPAVDLDLYRRR